MIINETNIAKTIVCVHVVVNWNVQLLHAIDSFLEISYFKLIERKKVTSLIMCLFVWINEYIKLFLVQIKMNLTV